MNKFLYTIGLALTFSLGVMAQDTVNGIVKDPSGKPLSGVKVSKVGEFRNNSVTDNSGAFSLVLEEELCGCGNETRSGHRQCNEYNA